MSGAAHDTPREGIARTSMTLRCALSFAMLLLAASANAADVLTSRGDDGRTGANLRETLLTIDNVNGDAFGRIHTYSLQLNDGRDGGDVYAQPLVVSHIGIPHHGVRNLLVVATTNNLVVALDADARSGDADTIIWKRELGPPPTIEQMLPGLTFCTPPTYADAMEQSALLLPALTLVLTIPGLPQSTRNELLSAMSQPTPAACTNVRPGGHVGIMSTPVIDRQRGLIFVSARTRDASGGIHHNLHALDLRTGEDRAGSPVEMRGRASGVDFEPQFQNQRVGLALADGHVIVAFGAHEDKEPYHGWVMSYRYDAGIGFQQTGIFVTTSSHDTGFPCNFTRNTCAHGGIWQSGRAPAVDRDGRVLLFVGNGKNDLKSDASNANFGNSFLALHPRTLDVLDFYTPANHTIPYPIPIPADWFARLSAPERVSILAAQRVIGISYGVGINEFDLDLGGSGPMIVPDSLFVVGGGKQGVMHVWRLDSLGGFSSDDASVVQKFAAGDEKPQHKDVAGEDSAFIIPIAFPPIHAGHIMGGPVYWPRPANAGSSLMFNWSEDSELRSYTADPTATPPLDPMPHAKGTFVQHGHPGGILALSANHAVPRSGIVWAATYDAHEGDDTGALKTVRPGVLRAYAADTLAEIWNSRAAARDNLGDFAKFVPPTVANGRVYMATFSNDVKVYGLRHHRYARAAAEIFTQAVLPLLEDPLLDD